MRGERARPAGKCQCSVFSGDKCRSTNLDSTVTMRLMFGRTLVLRPGNSLSLFLMQQEQSPSQKVVKMNRGNLGFLHGV